MNRLAGILAGNGFGFAVAAIVFVVVDDPTTAQFIAITLGLGLGLAGLGGLLGAIVDELAALRRRELVDDRRTP